MGLPDSRVDEMLELVSLDQTEAKRRLRNYSLGMKQRLGIAHALLGDPSVLILDEPANGLDPAGIRWMRGLLKGYAERGGTVLLSSHLLNEVEQIADEMILIGHGKIVAQGDKKSLLAGAPSTTTSRHRARQRAARQGAHRPRASPSRRRRPACGSRPRRSRSAAPPPRARIVLTDLRSADGGLEDLFLDLTADPSATTSPRAPSRHPPPPKEPRHEHDRPRRPHCSSTSRRHRTSRWLGWPRWSFARPSTPVPGAGSSSGSSPWSS